ILDRKLATEVQAVPGAAAAVRSIAGPKCVCSNSTPERLSAMLERAGLLDLFDGNIFSARAIPSGKPKRAPGVFLYAAETLKDVPEECSVIEDPVHGITAAKRAGLPVIGSTGGGPSWVGRADAVTEAGAETVIRRWAELPAVLAALSE